MIAWFTRHRLRVIVISLLSLSLLLVWSGSRSLNGFHQAKLASSSIRALDLRLEGLDFDSLPEISSLHGRISFLNSQISSAKSQLTPFIQIAPQMGWVPRYGPELRSSKDMLELGGNLAQTSQSLLVALEIIISQTSQTNTQLLQGNQINENVLVSLTRAEPHFRDAMSHLEKARKIVEVLQDRDLPPSYLSMVRSAKNLTPSLISLAGTGLVATGLWESFLGYDEPRSYLLVAQNSDELRASGGFIPGAWILTLDQGNITQLVFWDTVNVDDLSASPLLPPEGLLQSLWAGVWLFRDAGWDPDFPTSATVMEQILKLGQDITVDGVIAFDQLAFADILQAIGPITLPTGDILDGSSFTRILENGSDILGREFMDIALSAVLDRLREQGTNRDMLSLLLALNNSLTEKHVLLFFHEQALQEVSETNGWTGSLADSSGDFLMVVDSNVGFSKVNPNISRRIAYSVDLSHDTPSAARLEIQYTNQSRQLVADPCAVQSAGRGGVPYQQLKNSCYWNYLRVYTPEGAVLVSSSPFPMPEGALYQRIGYNDIEDTLRAYTSQDKSVFAGFFKVDIGETKIVAFEYRLPLAAVRSHNKRLIYNLFLQKQPGLSTTKVEVNVRLPDGYCMRQSDLSAIFVGPSEVEFKVDLRSDTVLEIDLERKTECNKLADSPSGLAADLPEGRTKTAFGSLMIVPTTEGSAPHHIQITPNDPALIRGQRFLFTAVVFDQDGRLIQDAGLSWRVKDPLAGTISATGLFNAGLANGRYSDVVEVTATSAKGWTSATTGVEILTANEAETRQLDSVILYPSQITVRPGQTVGIGALGWDSQGRFVQNLQFKWRMAETEAGTVNQFGFFEASSTPGRFINAIEVIVRQITPEGVVESRAFASVTVSEAIQRGTLAQLVTIPHRVVLTPGQQVIFIARAFDVSSQPLRGLDFTWNVTQSSVGQFVEPGRFIAGTEIGQFPNAIQVVATQQTANGPIQARTNITVAVVPPRVVGDLDLVYIVPGEVTLSPGQQFVFTSIGIDSQGNPVQGGVEWEVEFSVAGSIKPSGVFKAGSHPGIYPDAIQVRMTQVLDGKETVVVSYTTVNVLGPLDGLRVTRSVVLESGRSMWLSAVGYDANGLEIPFLQFRWSLENPEIGTVTSAGFFTAGDKLGAHSNAVKVVAVELDTS